MSLKLEELQKEWEKDCAIDETNLGAESSRNPILHCKYIRFLSDAKLAKRRAESKYLAMRRDKIKYYRGEMTREELAERGWQQYQGNKPLKTELNEILQLDNDLVLQEDRVSYLETVVYFLESVMKMINGRTWDIRNAVEWTKIQNGIV